nr:immunoglobulin light chain junction region [Macaca mulatta]
RQQETNWIFTF